MVSQRVAGLADGRVILVEHLTVGEDQTNVINKLVSRFVSGRNQIQLFLDSGQIHGIFDDLFVGGKLFHIDRVEERPSIVHGLHLRDDG